jgi:hypothetical protein
MWFKVDSGFLRHPKVRAAAEHLGGPQKRARKRALGRIAAVWLELGLYGSDYLTDGFVPNAEIDDLKTETNGREVTDALVHAKLAHRETGGIRLHDWEDYNPSADETKRKKKQDRDRKRQARGAADTSTKSPRGQRVDALRAESDRTNHARDLADSDWNPERSRARDPVPSRPVEEPEEPRGSRRAQPARMTLSLDEVRTHLQAAVHALIETGAPFVDALGQPDDGALLLELKDIAGRDLGAEWTHSAELGRIVDGVIGERARRRTA